MLVGVLEIVLWVTITSVIIALLWRRFGKWRRHSQEIFLLVPGNWICEIHIPITTVIFFCYINIIIFKKLYLILKTYLKHNYYYFIHWSLYWKRIIVTQFLNFLIYGYKKKLIVFTEINLFIWVLVLVEIRSRI